MTSDVRATRVVRLPYSVGERLRAFSFVPAVSILLGLALAVGIQFGSDTGLDSSFAMFGFFASIGLPFALVDTRFGPRGVRSGLGPLSLRISFDRIDRFEIGAVGYYRTTALRGVVAVTKAGKIKRLRLSLAVSVAKQDRWVAMLQDALLKSRQA